MPCYSPLKAFRARDGAIVFSRNHSLTGAPLDLPCGQCVGCRLERSRQWAVRCLHEKKQWRHNCFVTLTYDEQHVPHDGSLQKRDLTLFFKRLRKNHDGVRYMACGEYGENFARPHYHAILFNCQFSDAALFTVSAGGNELYRSRELERLWPFGHSSVGEVTFESAAYVARYCLKKITGDLAADHYGSRTPEYNVMSRRPGIGAGYYVRYGQEVRDNDSVVVNGHECKPPRFYDTRTEKHDLKAWEKIKKKRKRDALLRKADNTPARLRVKERLAIKTLEQKQRMIG